MDPESFLTLLKEEEKKILNVPIQSFNTNETLFKSLVKFVENIGVGEREGRVLCSLVRERNLGFAHGIGRSGNLCEVQPKAAGSSILYKLTNFLVLDYLKLCGMKAKECIVVPMATGMTISLALSFLCSKVRKAVKADNAEAATENGFVCKKKYVLFLRMDQKSAFKAIVSLNLIPICIEPQQEEDSLSTNLQLLESQINLYKADNILCILATTSCFAPRVPDNLAQIAKLSAKYQLELIVNNAYGLQSPKCINLINEAFKHNPGTIVVQSTDKNLLVPVGGAIIAVCQDGLIEKIADCYAGRASVSPILDVLITILSLGSNEIMKLHQSRIELLQYALDKLAELESKYKTHLRILKTPKNDISIGIQLLFPAVEDFGSKMFFRKISGSRVISCNNSTKCIDNYKFVNYGSHSNSYPYNYMTCAICLGMKKEEIDEFLHKLDKILNKQSC